MVVEADRPVSKDFADSFRRFLFEEIEAGHYIGHLDAGIVDVVLHLDLVAASAEHADEGIAEDGVAQMANVGGLVGVDVRMLDDDLAGAGRRSSDSSEQGGSISSAIESEIDVAV